MIYSIDTNILVYAEGVGDEGRCLASQALLQSLIQRHGVLPAQVLGELHRALVRKAQRTPEEATQSILEWSDAFEVLDSTWPAFQSAFDLCANHHIPIWDALVVSVSAEARARVLLSEDFQHGFTWRGVTIINPFLKPIHPLLRSLFE